MLGGRSIDEVIDHAGAFVAALSEVTGVIVDLGAGGGVPGLVIATARPDLRLVLVDRRTTRTDHLRRLVGRLGMSDRIEVVTADATSLTDLGADGAVARGFGAPAVTLAAATAVVRSGALIVVSEPPMRDPTRWPADLLQTSGVMRVEQPDARVAVFRRHVPRET